MNNNNNTNKHHQNTTANQRGNMVHSVTNYLIDTIAHFPQFYRNEEENVSRGISSTTPMKKKDHRHDLLLEPFPLKPRTPSFLETILDEKLSEQQRLNDEGKIKKNVSFNSSLVIIEHDIEIGDHPSCHSGLPIALGKKRSTRIVDMEQFEIQRSGRTREQLILSYCDRKRWLKENSGYSEQELIVAEIQAMTKRAKQSTEQRRDLSKMTRVSFRR